MKETTTTEIYNYLKNFKCDLNVKVTNNNDILNEQGNATKASSMNGFYIGNNYTNIYLTGETYPHLTFYADYPEFTLTGVIGACNVSGGGGSKKKKRKSRRVSKKSNKKRNARTKRYR